ncbi:hypothetical protein [Micromonospora sp. WMMA1976]|uniref:hypothetical protein n=1 Tax=Micromonospora TaxID=1873 RepID=UPI00248ABC47|nr:hypothetical protein [Micromonospora sp. WMMA1976]WBC05969.1 hypothetical protein O7546_13705 [Micromonospora sp. WMMA1976]
MTTHHPTTRRLVYGHAQMHDCLAFADADTAAEEAAEIKAIAAARAWGEAGRIRTTHLSNPADPECYDPDGGPDDDEPFDINEVSSVVEGDWPPLVAERPARCCRRTCARASVSSRQPCSTATCWRSR